MVKEFDVSEIAWETYRLMYASNLKQNFEIINGERKHICEIYKVNGKSSKDKIELSGDIDFNFTKGFAHSRLCCYENLVKKDIPSKYSDYSKMYQNNMDIMKRLTYSIVNISLIGKKGNLQGVKQGIGNDRLDTFIWALSEYYDKNINLLINYSSYQNLNELKNYLDMFDGIYEYCNEVYHINVSLVDELIEFGKQPIDTSEQIIKFMKLAIRFWSQKLQFLNKEVTEQNTRSLQVELEKIQKELDELFPKNE